MDFTSDYILWAVLFIIVITFSVIVGSISGKEFSTFHEELDHRIERKRKEFKVIPKHQSEISEVYSQGGETQIKLTDGTVFLQERRNGDTVFVSYCPTTGNYKPLPKVGDVIEYKLFDDNGNESLKKLIIGIDYKNNKDVNIT